MFVELLKLPLQTEWSRLLVDKSQYWMSVTCRCACDSVESDCTKEVLLQKVHASDNSAAILIAWPELCMARHWMRQQAVPFCITFFEQVFYADQLEHRHREIQQRTANFEHVHWSVSLSGIAWMHLECFYVPGWCLSFNPLAVLTSKSEVQTWEPEGSLQRKQTFKCSECPVSYSLHQSLLCLFT